MNVCLLGDALVPTEKTVTGYGIAVDLIASSIITFSDFDQLYLLCEKDTYHYQRMEEFKNNLPPDKQKRIHIVDEYDVFLHGTGKLNEIDVIHSLQADALKAMCLRNELNKNVPIVLTMHGLSEQRLYMYLYIPLMIGSFRSYDAIICTSEAVRDAITRVFVRLKNQFPHYIKNVPKILLKKIPLGVDTDYFKPIDRALLRKRWNVGADAFVILWFGRLSKNHKADLFPLLKVFSNLVVENRSKDLLLIIAGSSSDGSYEREMLETAELMGIADFVRLISANEVHNRNELYNVCDVFTSPIDNIQETFGITPIEAMAAGTAQVVSDWDGYRDTVQDGLTGYLIPTYWMHDCLEDVLNRDFLPLNDMHRREFFSFLETESVAVDITVYQDRLQRLIDSSDLLQYFRTMSRERALEVYEISHVIKQIESLWDELVCAARNDGTPTFQKLHLTDYCHDFEGYPSKMLDDDTRFVVSEYYHMWKDKIKPTTDITKKQINEIKEMLLERNVLSVNDILLSCNYSNRAMVRRILMYFLKNGLIIIKGENSNE